MSIAVLKGGWVSGIEGGAKECQVFCQVPITLDFLPTHPHLTPTSNRNYHPRILTRMAILILP